MRATLALVGLTVAAAGPPLASAAAPAFTIARAERAVAASVRVHASQAHVHAPAFRVSCRASRPASDRCSVRAVATGGNLYGVVSAYVLPRGDIGVGSDDGILNCVYHANDRATCRLRP